MEAFDYFWNRIKRMRHRIEWCVEVRLFTSLTRLAFTRNGGKCQSELIHRPYLGGIGMKSTFFAKSQRQTCLVSLRLSHKKSFSSDPRQGWYIGSPVNLNLMSEDSKVSLFNVHSKSKMTTLKNYASSKLSAPRTWEARCCWSDRTREIENMLLRLILSQ